MRYEFIQKEKKAFPITMLCKMMKVTRSGFYAWTTRGESRHYRENKAMAMIIKATHEKAKASYGARRHASELTSQGLSCGRYRARTVMALAEVEAKQKKRFKATTDSNHNKKVFPNLLKREFTVLEPNIVGSSSFQVDFSKFWIGAANK